MRLFHTPVWMLAACFSLGIGLTSCDDDDDDNGDPQTPTNYSFGTVNQNASGEQQALTSLSNLASTMSEIESDPSRTYTYDELLAIYENGNRSLSELTADGYRDYLAEPNNGILKLFADASASDTTFSAGDTAGVHSLDSSDFFLADGREPLQLVEKGLFSAALYHTAATLLNKDELTAADFDKAFVLFGAPADFPNDEGTNDGYGANYVSDRDNDGTDFYVNVRDGLLEGRVAVENGDQSAAQEAAAKVVENWETGLAATAVHYCIGTRNNLADEKNQDAYHQYGEAYGFLGGLAGTEGDIITDQQVQDLLDQLREPTTVGPREDLNGVISELETIYDFGVDASAFE